MKEVANHSLQHGTAGVTIDSQRLRPARGTPTRLTDQTGLLQQLAPGINVTVGYPKAEGHALIHFTWTKGERSSGILNALQLALQHRLVIELQLR